MPNILQELTQYAPRLFTGTPVRFAYLYGSYATGSAHKHSDLDIAVFIDPTTPDSQKLKIELSLSLKLDELFDHQVQSDIRTINDLPLTIQGTILSEGKLIYSTDEDLRVDFEVKTRMLYFDFMPVIEQYRKLYLQSQKQKFATPRSMKSSSKT